jgi:hypothetical protein
MSETTQQMALLIQITSSNQSGRSQLSIEETTSKDIHHFLVVVL